MHLWRPATHTHICMGTLEMSGWTRYTGTSGVYIPKPGSSLNCIGTDRLRPSRWSLWIAHRDLGRRQ